VEIDVAGGRTMKCEPGIIVGILVARHLNNKLPGQRPMKTTLCLSPS